MQARCSCGNGVFIVMVQPYKGTDKTIDVRYECTICPRTVLFVIGRADAEAFCAGLNGTFGTDKEGDDDDGT